MEEYSKLSLEAAIDLVKNARSEKVRADLAIEGIRHKISSPTVKVQSQESKVVHITFGEPPKEDSEIEDSEIIEGEVVDASESDELGALDETDRN